MKKRMMLTAVAWGAFLSLARATVEPVATLNVASIEKLGTAISQISAVIGQPMLGALAMGSIQQYLQTTVGPCDSTKPGAVVLYADPSVLQGKTTEELTAAFSESVRVGVIFPLSGTQEQYIAGKQLKKDANGFVRLPDGAGHAIATFQGEYMFVSQEASYAEQTKKGMKTFLARPTDGNVLALRVNKAGIGIYRKFLAVSANSPSAKTASCGASFVALSKKTQDLTDEVIAQYATVSLELGFSPAKGLTIASNINFVPGSKMAQQTASVKGMNPALFSFVPDGSFLYSMESGDSLKEGSKETMYTAIDAFCNDSIRTCDFCKKDPELAKILSRIVSSGFSAVKGVEQRVCAIGYAPNTCLWVATKTTENPETRGTLYKVACEGNKDLFRALNKAFPAQKFLTVSPDGTQLHVDFSKWSTKDFLAAVSVKTEETEEKEDTKQMEEGVKTTIDILSSLFGKKFCSSTKQTPDGVESYLSAEGADAFWTAPRGAEARADAARFGGGNDLVQFSRLSLYGLIRNVGVPVLSGLPQENPLRVYATILGTLPPADHSTGIFSTSRTVKGGSRGMCVISTGEIKKITEGAMIIMGGDAASK